MDQLEKNDAGLLTMLKRGDIVRAICSIPACPRVKTGMSGVVYEEAEFHESGSGPMVRWFNGQRCNVYDGDVSSEDTGLGIGKYRDQGRATFVVDKVTDL